MKPKVFISYSWRDQPHQEFVVKCAERLTADGVDVVLDLWDLKVGQDKNAFMERMVTDTSVTHVLVFCDKSYTAKADAKRSGVGTESQIISEKVYNEVAQTKFVPLACEFNDSGQPYLPVFLSSRIWINFSSPEQVHENWEKLIRLLYGKALYVKPEIGTAPVYLSQEPNIPATPANAKFESLRQAIVHGKKNLNLYRREFLETCFEYADKLRTRTPIQEKDAKKLGEKILQDCEALLPIRDKIVEWVLLESELAPSTEFLNALIEFLEQVRVLRSRPQEITSWSEAWFEAHKLFGYELFLYVIAALLKTKSYEFLHEIYTTHYLKNGPQDEGNQFAKFGVFYAYSEILNPILSPPGKKLYSAAAELVKRHAIRTDLPFGDIVQADLLTLLIAFIDPETRWYPQMLYYASYGREFPFFVRAAQHKNFVNLATITGIKTADELRAAVREGHKRLDVEKWHNFLFERNFWKSMNMDSLDTLR